MNIFYGKIKVQDGNFITKQRASKMPKIILDLQINKIYTILLMDPDAVGGNKIHFLLTNHSLYNEGNIIFPYVGPNPPKSSGVHRYYFLLIEQNSFVLPNPNLANRFISIKKILTFGSFIAQKYFTSHA